MTIEAKIEALTAAVNNLTGAIAAAHATTLGSDPVAKPARNAAKAVAEHQQPNGAVTATIGAPADIAAKVLTYEDIKIPFLALVRKNRDQALATLKPFGLESLKPAKPEQFAAILSALNNALAS